MSETTPLIKAALNLRVGVGFDVYEVSSIEGYGYSPNRTMLGREVSQIHESAAIEHNKLYIIYTTSFRKYFRRK